MASARTRSLYGRLPVGLQQIVVAVAGWRSYRDRFGPRFREILAELETNDRLGSEAVRDDQERRLREAVRHAAASVPFYRERFRAEGLDPARIRNLEDLRLLPVLDKETVRQRAAELVSEAVPERQRVTGHSSGTTGTALPLVYTREGLAWEYAASWRQRGWWGLALGDRFAAFGGQMVVPFEQKSPPFWRYDLPRKRVLFSLYHMTPANLAHYARELARPGYRFWQGYPSSIALVCDWLREHGFSLGAAAPRAIFTSSESLLEAQRAVITGATGARVADRYAHSELAVSVSQCPEGRYHVDTEFGVVEIDAHEETDEWVRGEVIATGFANRAMPLLRYRTGDVATLEKRALCPCGRARPVLSRIDGRIEDYIVTPDGRRIGRMDHIFKDALEVKEAQIYQPSQRRIVVRFVPRVEFDESVRHRLEQEFRNRLGDEIEIGWERVDAIPRQPNGKFRAVVSDLDVAKLVRSR